MVFPLSRIQEIKKIYLTLIRPTSRLALVVLTWARILPWGAYWTLTGSGGIYMLVREGPRVFLNGYSVPERPKHSEMKEHAVLSDAKPSWRWSMVSTSSSHSPIRRQLMLTRVKEGRERVAIVEVIMRLRGVHSVKPRATSTSDE